MVHYLYHFPKSTTMKSKMIIPISVFAVNLGSACGGNTYSSDNSASGGTKIARDSTKKTKSNK
jgi:hypothetical protein